MASDAEERGAGLATSMGSLFSCTAARSVAMSLLELPGAIGTDGHCPPTHNMEQDFTHVGLDT